MIDNTLSSPHDNIVQNQKKTDKQKTTVFTCLYTIRFHVCIVWKKSIINTINYLPELKLKLKL